MSEETSTKLMQLLLQHTGEKQSTFNINVSKIGQCIRKTYYEINNTPPDEDLLDTYNKDKFAMAFGELFELYITRLFSELGIPNHKEYVYDRKLKITGITDPIIKLDGQEIITEIKATHGDHYQVLYDQVRYGNEPEIYKPQLQGYLWLLPKTDYGMYIIGNRGWRRKDKLPPIFLHSAQRDKVWYKENFEGRLPVLNEHLDNNTLPEREYNEPDRYPCSYCQFQVRCYGKDSGK